MARRRNVRASGVDATDDVMIAADAAAFRVTSAKSTCRKCERTVVVVNVEGVRYEVDPEIINVVTLEGGEIVHARRAHADMCTSYQVERDKRVAKDKLRGSFAGGFGRRPSRST